MKVDGTTVPDYLAAYNFGSVGQNENADRLMGGFTFDDTVFPYVDFIDNDTIACFGDDRIVIYSMNEKPSEKAEISLDGREMLGVFANSHYVGYISANADTSAGRYHIYYLNGAKKFSTTFRKNLIDIVPSGNKLEYIAIFENETTIIKLTMKNEKENK